MEAQSVGDQEAIWCPAACPGGGVAARSAREARGWNRPLYRVPLGDVMVSPMLTYDDAQEVWAAQLPLYLLRDKNALFSGGLRFGWRSDEDRFVASVFVSTPLGFD